jgi:hypothetical protein
MKKQKTKSIQHIMKLAIKKMDELNIFITILWDLLQEKNGRDKENFSVDKEGYPDSK